MRNVNLIDAITVQVEGGRLLDDADIDCGEGPPITWRAAKTLDQLLNKALPGQLDVGWN